VTDLPGMRKLSAACAALVLVLMTTAYGYESDLRTDEAVMGEHLDASSPIESPITHDRVCAPVDVEPTTARRAASMGIAASQLPARFDLRDEGYVTGVKNQGASPSCWAFAAYGSLESTIAVAGGAASDLSENHLKDWHGYDSGPNSGGNQYMTEAYLSRWDGPVSEADDPYHDSNDFPSPGGPPQCYVREVLMLDTASEIKQCLMTYGAIAGGMNGDATHYDAASKTYYFDGEAQPAHGVTMVGWDDDKVVPNAPGPGAWLIKNSWGSQWGDDGYVWLSYYDSCGGKFGFCFCDAVAPDTYQKIYSHDYFGNVGSLSYDYACNAFTATCDQELVAVRFWTKADGAGYEIRIYDNLDGDALTGLLGSATGTCALAGVHTVDLPAPVHLVEGNEFYICLHITDGGAFPLACDWAIEGYTGSCTSAPGQSYFSLDGNHWTDLETARPTANFCIRGLATTAAPPEITVLGNEVAIDDGDMASSPTDNTFFGSAVQGDLPVSRTFTVRNDGAGTLVLDRVTVPSGFALTDVPAATLAPDASDTFSVRLNTDEVGTKSGHVVIVNDDCDEHPFNFAVSGIVLGPEIAVGGSGWLIVNGDTTPWLTDGTDFGIAALGGTPISRTFLVRNEGNADLTLGTVTAPTGFTVTEDLVPSLASQTSDTFTIQLDTAIAGLKTGTVDFLNDDSDENPFNFTIVGVVTDEAEVTVLGNEMLIVDGDTTPSTDDYTNVGSAVVYGPALSRTFTVRNDGALPLTLGPVRVPEGFTVVEDLSPSLPPGESDTFTIRLETTVAGIKSGDLSFSTNDSDENPYHFRITGRVAGFEQPIAFPDANLKRAVEETLGITNPTPTDMLALTDFWGWGRGIRNLEGLQYAENAILLHLGGGPCADISPLAGLTNLTTLWLDHCPVSDISPLSGLTNLTFLDIGTTEVRDLSPLAGLTNLVELHAIGNQITDITPLAGLTNLDYLDLFANDYIVDISALAGLTDLTFLNLWGNDISDISPLAALTNLTYLELGFNSVSDLGPLAGMTKLNHLSLAGNQVSDVSALTQMADLTYLDLTFGQIADVTPLAGLTQLTHLGLGSNRVYDVTPVAGLPNLTHLNLDNNKTSDITSLVSLTNLTELSLANLCLPNDDLVTLLANLPNLTTLEISANHVGDLSMVSHLTKLTVLHANGNKSPFNDLSPLSALKDLTDLEINSNRVSDISVLAHLTKLTNVHLNTNYIRDLSPLSEATALKKLDLRANPLDPEAYAVYIPLILAHNPKIELHYDPPSLSEITVLYNGIVINNGDATPDTADGTDFGTVLRGSPPISRTYTVRNDGTEMLEFHMIVHSTLPPGFIWKGGPRNLMPGESDTIEIQLDTSASGTKAGDFSFRTNDQDENPFHFRITGTVEGGDPEITVLGNGISISDGDTTPSMADGTDFGTVLRGSETVSHTFLVRNDGTSILTFNRWATLVPDGFRWHPEGRDYNIAPGGSNTFTILLDTAEPGTKTGDFSVPNSDPDENPFNFRITGTVVGGDPDITVLCNGISISDGGTTPNVADGTDFGTVLRAGAPVSHTFVVRNDGTSILTFGPPSQVPAGFTWTAGWGATLAPGESSTFTIQLDTKVSGTKTGEYVFNNNDPNENPFNFRISGTVRDANPEITVLGNGLSIGNGDTTPSAADGTDFGTILRGSAPVSHAFVVRNDGTDMLRFTMFGPSTLVPNGFTWKGGPRDLAPGESDTMTIQLDTNVAGAKTGDFSFSNNDQDENPFHFRITGTVADADPEISVLGNGISIGDGDTTPSVDDGTDFGIVLQNSTPVMRTFTVRNDGTESLTLGAPTVPAGFTLTEGLSANLAPGAWDTFTIRLDTVVAGTKSGEVLYANNDSDENPFNFRITGTVVSGDSGIAVLGNGISISDGDTTPSAADGTDFGIVLHNSTPVLRTFTVRNDGTESLTLGAPIVPAGFTLTEGLSASLAPGASDTFTIQLDTAAIGTKTGDVVVANTSGDESLFTFRIAAVVTVPGAPEITVLGNGRSIADGDSSPHTTDGTHFGSVPRGSPPVSHVFLVRNNGTDILVLGPVTVPAGFTLTEGLSASLAPGALDTFTVQLDTAAAGTKTGEVLFANSDADENPFNFQIAGTVTP